MSDTPHETPVYAMSVAGLLWTLGTCTHEVDEDWEPGILHLLLDRFAAHLFLACSS